MLHDQTFSMMHHDHATAIRVTDLLVKGQEGFRLEMPSLSVPAGSMVALIGRNGSGKSTFLDAVLNLLSVDGGSIEVLGKQLRKLPAKDPIRSRIGLQAQGTTWAWSIKVGEILAIHRTLYGVSDPGIIDLLGVRELSAAMYRKLSTGQRRRVDLAVALAHRPDMIVLDEPSSGLDTQYLRAFHEILEERRAAMATILIASHEALDVGLADRILWFDQGRIIADCPPSKLVGEKIGDFVGIVKALDDERAATLAAELGQIDGVTRASRDGKHIFYGGETLREPFVAAIERMKVDSYEIRPADASDLLDLMTNATQREGVSP